MLKRVIRNYWLAEETNIFRNYRDALAGFVALVIIPAVSIFFATLSVGNNNTILPYVAPILQFVCGLFLTFEIYNRVKRAVLISPWLV